MAERIAYFQQHLNKSSASQPDAVQYWKDARFVIFENVIQSVCEIAEIHHQFFLLCGDTVNVSYRSHYQEVELAAYASIDEMLADETKVFITVNIWSENCP